MERSVKQDAVNRGDWRVEEIDHENEGVVRVAIFSGPNARERAFGYYKFIDAVSQFTL